MKKNQKQLKEKTIKQLLAEEETVRREISKLSLEFKTSMPKDTNVIVKKKKHLAMLLTILGQKRALESVSS